jgi:hypothetical protein
MCCAVLLRIFVIPGVICVIVSVYGPGPACPVVDSQPICLHCTSVPVNGFIAIAAKPGPNIMWTVFRRFF